MILKVLQKIIIYIVLYKWFCFTFKKKKKIPSAWDSETLKEDRNSINRGDISRISEYS
jgi:hypothetical protein